VTLKEVDGPAGAPWEPELKGRLDKLVVRSEILAENPLGDSATRPLYVYSPPGADGSGPLPSIYLIQGFTGQVDMWANRELYQPNMFERLDRLFGESTVPPAIVVFVDAWTSLGGSQFINSRGTGRYLDYLCDEIVPFVDDRYSTASSREHRGITGKSSGGYGAVVVPMLRPDVFGALASHAGDALFEACFPNAIYTTVRLLRDKCQGSWDVFWEKFKTAEKHEDAWVTALMIYAMAACYSPSDEDPLQVEFPVDMSTGLSVPEVWDKWLQWDPIRMAPDHVDALKSMRLIYLEAGTSDEFFLDVGTQALSARLRALGIDHDVEFFDAGHMRIQYRYPAAIRRLADTLTPG
jgi:S-formylglutathione hydrolase FrmB